MYTKNHPKWVKTLSLVALFALLAAGLFGSIAWYLEQQPIKGMFSHRGLVNIEQWINSRGTRLYFSKRDELPMVDIVLRWDAGAIREKEDHGLAHLTRAVLTEGTSILTANQLAEKLESLGVEFHESTEHDYSELSLRVINDPDKIKQAVTLLSQMLSLPAFREKDLERVRKDVIAELEYQAHNPSDIARLAFIKAVYGSTHPYGRSVLGDIAHVERYTVAQLRDFYQKNYSTRNLTVAVVGALNSRAVERLVLNLTEGLATHALPDITLNPPAKVGQEEKIQFPAVQTKVTLGCAAIARDDPDRYALLVGNQILGENALYNRLIKEIRVERGLAYSAGSIFDMKSLGGTFRIVLATRNEQVKEAESVARQVLAAFIQHGPTQEELDRIKKTILGRLPLEVASNSNALGIIADLGFNKLPIDGLERFRKAVEAMTTLEIQTAFARHIDPAKLTLVTVGGSA